MSSDINIHSFRPLQSVDMEYIVHQPADLALRPLPETCVRAAKEARPLETCPRQQKLKVTHHDHNPPRHPELSRHCDIAVFGRRFPGISSPPLREGGATDGEEEPIGAVGEDYRGVQPSADDKSNASLVMSGAHVGQTLPRHATIGVSGRKGARLLCVPGRLYDRT